MEAGAVCVSVVYPATQMVAEAGTTLIVRILRVGAMAA
jgi:hypothetical protein